ncbi:glycosyl hydrolase family 61-domain-containing protein [Mycena pura]|uniref:lytic cellulose monooxygenase (C4-dehydrogenating) n=1 Tax=Mycena pura TaxID=153505 RepID=A0AAD6YE14_9AGAR|nr:glycosyl hydrolase family 61-domain-containing protein [Mycena pura]
MAPTAFITHAHSRSFILGGRTAVMCPIVLAWHVAKTPPLSILLLNPGYMRKLVGSNRGISGLGIGLDDPPHFFVQRIWAAQYTGRIFLPWPPNKFNGVVGSSVCSLYAFISSLEVIMGIFSGFVDVDVFPTLTVGGVNSTAWQFIRQTNNWQDLNPVTDVTTTDVRCYTSLESGTSSTTSVAAGSSVTFSISGNPSSLYHDGVVNVYMAKAPAGTDVSAWDGSGDVWFKIFQIPAIADGVTITFPALELTEVTVTIPSQTPSGQYLLRVEHIALHVAEVFQGAQFYIACAQLQVTNGGSGTPGPLVAFPGAYTGMASHLVQKPALVYQLTMSALNRSPAFCKPVCSATCSAHPRIIINRINIYWPIPTSYIQPGPAVWPAVGSGSAAPPTTSGQSTSVKSTAPPTTSVKTTAPPTSVKSTTAPPTTVQPTTPASSPSSPSGSVAEWGQCGGQGYTGPTACVAPFACNELNPFFFQCF